MLLLSVDVLAIAGATPISHLVVGVSVYTLTLDSCREALGEAKVTTALLLMTLCNKYCFLHRESMHQTLLPKMSEFAPEGNKKHIVVMAEYLSITIEALQEYALAMYSLHPII